MLVETKSEYFFEKGWSNWVKLIAAIMVALSHYSSVIVFNNHWSNNPLIAILAQGGYIGVAIFFFFSGYGLMESETKHHTGSKDFFIRRLSKVYLPVLLVSAIWIPIYYIVLDKSKVLPPLQVILYDLFWGFRDVVLWFVKILIFLYAIFYSFTTILKKGHRYIANMLLITLLVFSTFLAYKVDYPFISVPLFGIGIYSSMFKQKRVIGFPVCMVLIILYGILGAICQLLISSANTAHMILNAVIMIPIFSIFKYKTTPPPIRLKNSWVVATFTIYIVHFKVLVFLTNQYGHITIWSYILSTCIVTIIITYLRKLIKI